MKAYLLSAAYLIFVSAIAGQSFTKIIDAANPPSIITQGGYPGTSWIDYNNDDLIDLFINPDNLFKNTGSGNFAGNPDLKGRTQLLSQSVIGSGNSWADYNNDGFIDLFFASGKSFLFRNNGDETFTKITEGQIGDSIGNRGWTSAWADYDNDGNVDLLIVHPANFVPGAPTSNHLYHNDGPPDYTFTRVTADYEFNTVQAPYTVATWYDYDLDGDVDLFIASGPASQNPARDYLYKNLLIETGSVGFERINDSPIGTDLQDGQVWNWIDFDNDGDLDAFLTNYRSASNRLYINGNGTYKSIPHAMELNNIQCLANTWGDFDNDGFLDVIITSEIKNYFFHNNGDGTFAPVQNAIDANAPERGATIGDYDNDGDLDVFIIGFQGASGLFRNDNNNQNSWIKFQLKGTKSNRSAIGATLRLKASINGNPVWLIRQVAAQNSFNSQNSLVQHFGLGDASIIDTVIINWPSGEDQVLSDIPVNALQSVVESTSTGLESQGKETGYTFDLLQNYPNPFNPTTSIQFTLPEHTFIHVNIFDILGNKITTLFTGYMSEGKHSIIFDASGLASGTYYFQLTSEKFIKTNKMQLLK